VKLLVLGAGVVGVTSAWYLRQAGHEVTVLDRQPAAAQETSFANGGQISVSHAEPWANPHAPWLALKWFGREDAPLLFRLRADPALWAWSLSFLNECRPARTRRNTREITALGLYSRACLGELRRTLGLEYEAEQRGIMHFYTDPAQFEGAVKAAALMRELGCDRRVIDAAEAVAIEPALADMQSRIVGADFTALDESGDAMKFTQALARQAEAAGVQFLWGNAAAGLTIEGGQVSGAVLADGRKLAADAVVVALGAYSPKFLRPYGVSIPVYPAKGYSATYQLGEASLAPRVSLTDDAVKIVISRFGQRLRVAGTAEFSGYNLDLNLARCRLIDDRVRTLFPRLQALGEPQYWAGLRPATPSNRPLIGRARFPNLYLNTGHGTLGWTMSCGSAAALADLVGGRRPEPAFSFLGVDK
jgi:D-amino-acid dehydrogenase